jgi:hypothetical protein
VTVAGGGGAGPERFPYGAYPALYQAADAAAVGGQRAYVRLVGLELTLVILGAVLGSAAAFDPSLATSLPLLGALSFLAAAVLRIVSRDRRYDRQWFDARAVSETVRSATWRYMMRVPPYDQDPEADAELAGALRTALDARPELHGALPAAPGGTRQMSREMRLERTRPVLERRDRYRASRIGDQMAWYREKGAWHRRRSTQFFWLALAAQVGAIGVVGVGIIDPSLARFNFLGLWGAVATAATAMSQLNRHDDLSRTYGRALHELSLIDGLAEGVSTDPQLTAVVIDAEEVISREHNAWVTRGVAAGR